MEEISLVNPLPREMKVLPAVVPRSANACIRVHSPGSIMTLSICGNAPYEHIAVCKVMLEVGEVAAFCRVKAWEVQLWTIMVLKVRRSSSGGVRLREKEVRDGWAIKGSDVT